MLLSEGIALTRLLAPLPTTSFIVHTPPGSADARGSGNLNENTRRLRHGISKCGRKACASPWRSRTQGSPVMKTHVLSQLARNELLILVSAPTTINTPRAETSLSKKDPSNFDRGCSKHIADIISVAVLKPPGQLKNRVNTPNSATHHHKFSALVQLLSARRPRRRVYCKAFSTPADLSPLQTPPLIWWLKQDYDFGDDVPAEVLAKIHAKQYLPPEPGLVDVRYGSARPTGLTDHSSVFGAPSNLFHTPRLFSLEGRRRFQRRNPKGLEEFPYRLPQGATIRYYKVKESSWWRGCLASVAILLYALCWFVMILAPPFCIALFTWQSRQVLSAWLRQQERALLDTFRQPLLLAAAEASVNLESFLERALAVGTRSFNLQAIPAVVRSMRKSLGLFSSWYLEKCSEGSLVSRAAYIYAAIFVANSVWAGVSESRLRRRLVKALEMDDKPGRRCASRWEQRCSLWDQLRSFAGIFRFLRHYFPPGSSVVYEDFERFKKARDENKLLLSYHPHGVVSFGLSTYLLTEDFENLRLISAPFIHFCAPTMRLILASTRIRLGSAQKENFRRYLDNKENIALVPGGVPEVSLAQTGKERLYLRHRKGFIKYALQHGYTVCPSYCFGENFIASQFFTGALETRLALNRWNIPTIIPTRLWPRRVPLLYVVGKPIELPKIPHPTPELIQRYHSLYVANLQKLYQRYADDYYELMYNLGHSEVPAAPPLILY